MTIVIDGSVYFDRIYRKYMKFRKNLNDKGTVLMNPVSMAIDYMLFTMTHMERLLRNYSFKVIYFNVNHRIGMTKRTHRKQRIIDGRLSRMFKDMTHLMETGEMAGIYMRYHEYFNETVKGYAVKDFSRRKIGYDYDNALPRMELLFIEEALREQNRLTPDDIFYCNRLLLDALTNCRVVYTESPNIDYIKYYKARFIRSANWKHYKRKESIIQKQPITTNVYTHFVSTRKYPLIDCCQTNSYDMFILTDDPITLYVKMESPIFLDENLLDDYVDVIDKLNDSNEDDVLTETYNYTGLVESIEPTEITEQDINIILDSVIKRWRPLFMEFDLRRLKVNKQPSSCLKNMINSSSISIDDFMEII